MCRIGNVYDVNTYEQDVEKYAELPTALYGQYDHVPGEKGVVRVGDGRQRTIVYLSCKTCNRKCFTSLCSLLGVLPALWTAGVCAFHAGV